MPNFICVRKCTKNPWSGHLTQEVKECEVTSNYHINCYLPFTNAVIFMVIHLDFMNLKNNALIDLCYKYLFAKFSKKLNLNQKI